MRVAEFNQLAPLSAHELLRSCCGAKRWIREMSARRPYASLDHLLAAAEAVWRETGPADWEEAFAQHPRIGESRARAEVTETARTWSAHEQGGLSVADDAARARLAKGNQAYERRFGRIFIVSAGGKSPQQLLENLESRLDNPPDEELRVAAAEQGKITLLRLRKTFSDDGVTT